MFKQTFKQRLITLSLFCGFLAHSQTSSFNVDIEGWTIIGDAGGVIQPVYNTSGGNLGGFISSKDEGTGGTWYFSAPPKFLGNKSWFYGQNLRFDLKQNRTDQQFNGDDIIIEGNGVKLIFKTANNPGLTWTSYVVRLDETANWRFPTGVVLGVQLSRKATQAEIKTVLCNVSKLWIRGEFVNGADEGGLDNAMIDGLDCTPGVSTQNPTICKGQIFSINNKSYKIAGTYRDTIKRCNPLCDSIIVINLKVTEPISKSQAPKICNGDSLKVGSSVYKKSGSYTDTLKSIGGCDSIVLTALTVIPLISVSQAPIICEGDALKIGDSTYTKAGKYRNVLKSALGCDSTIITDLTVNPKAVKILDVSICQGKGYRVGNKVYTQEGTFSDTIRRRAPLCDSIVTVKIKFSPLPEITENITICRNDSIYIRGRLFNGGGTYRDTFKTYTGGCDTVVVTNLKLSNLSLNLGSDIQIEKGDSVKLAPIVVGGKNLKWTWNPARDLSCAKCPDPISRPTKTVTYVVEVRDTTGNCTVKDNITISVKACERVFIPDAFSPNNDGTNDTFIAYGASCAKQIKKMAIFSRGGQMVFNQQNLALNNPSNGWDGMFNNKFLPSDVYVYVMEIEFGDGEVKTFSGDLTLIR
jgi:gliding motility-associated-like protein